MTSASSSAPKPRPALATWLFVALIAVTIAAALTFTLVIDRVMRAEARDDATAFLQAHADALRDALDRGMAQHVGEVQAIGRFDVLTRGSDAAAMRRTLEQMHASFPQFAWLGIADADGLVLAAVDGLLQGQSVAERPWFAGGGRQTYVGDVHRVVLLEKVLPRQVEPWRFVDIATPVLAPDGRLRGVLGAHLSWTWAAQVKRELVDRVLESHGAEAYLVAADGAVLLGPPVLQGARLPRADPAALFEVDARTRGQGGFPGLGWRVVLRQPEAVAMASFHVLQRRTVLAAILLCAVFAPLQWLLARRLAAPLRTLTARLEGGRPSAAAEAGPPLYREAELLQRAFDHHEARQAVGAAHQRELAANLEARLAERTEDLACSERRLRAITDALPALIAYVGPDERHRFCNGAYKAWLGREPEQVVGRTMSEILPPAPYAALRAHLARALGGERVDFHLESTLLGAARHLNATLLPDIGPGGEVAGVFTLITDISPLEKARQETALQASTDALTGLAHRHRFDEKLADALARSRRSKQAVAVFFLCVDGFEGIGDTLGPGAGAGAGARDEALKSFAQRLRASVRETDTVARRADAEFAVILEGLHSDSEPEIVARKILAAVARPFEVDGHALAITASIGIAYEADGRVPASELLARADRALDAARGAGGNAFRMAAAA
jgi:diguanylate cyclase (GGDEF)-like protein/PAS domain S-box-containing protein